MVMGISELQKLMVTHHETLEIEVEVHQCWDCDSEGEFYETVDNDLI